MKDRIYITFIIVIAVAAISSCTIEKRLYQRGYHVEWNGRNRELKHNFGKDASVNSENTNSVSNIIEDKEVENNFVNQTELAQSDEPIFASGDEISTNFEIVEMANDKSISLILNKNPLKSKISNTVNLKKPNQKTDEEPKYHWQAIAGFSLGILSWFSALVTGVYLLSFLFAVMIVTGMVFSILAIIKINKSPEIYRGKTFALFGIILNPIALFIVFVSAAVIISMYL